MFVGDPIVSKLWKTFFKHSWIILKQCKLKSGWNRVNEGGMNGKTNRQQRASCTLDLNLIELEHFNKGVRLPVDFFHQN